MVSNGLSVPTAMLMHHSSTGMPTSLSSSQTRKCARRRGLCGGKIARRCTPLVLISTPGRMISRVRFSAALIFWAASSMSSYQVGAVRSISSRLSFHRVPIPL